MSRVQDQFNNYLNDFQNQINNVCADKYRKFAESNINVLNAVTNGDSVCLVLEYSLERHSDRKLIWPKIAVVGDTLTDALNRADWIINAVRGY